MPAAIAAPPPSLRLALALHVGAQKRCLTAIRQGLAVLSDVEDQHEVEQSAKAAVVRLEPGERHWIRDAYQA